jgi:polysaccharide biosynthesis/export protein
MGLGTSRFSHCGRAVVLVFLSALLGITAAAQTPPSSTPANNVPANNAPANNVSPSQSSTPAEDPAGLPAIQTIPQAAVSASEPGSAISGSPAPASPAKAQENANAKDLADQSASVKLGAGDLLEVSVYNVPELASKVRVSNSGDVYLPLIDYVHVDGLTQEEAQTLIQKRLEDGGFVRSPHVTIFVDEAASQGVTVIGEIARPGIYPDVADHKLYEVISEAGGFTPSAARQIVVIRRNQTEPIRLDLPRNLGDDLSGNIEIIPGDTITIPRAPIIYVVGDVGRPSGLLVDNGSLTVLQALALAGGANRTAKLGDARILHKGPAGVMETKLEIKKMLEAKAPDVTLHADDILFIPVSGAKIAASRTFEAAVTVATGLTLYAVHP